MMTSPACKISARLAIILFFLLVSSGDFAFSAEEVVTIQLSAGVQDRVDSVVVCELPESISEAKHFQLTRIEDGVSIPVQRIAGGEPRIAWIVKKPLSAGKMRTYKLSAAEKEACEARVTCKDDGKSLVLKVGELPVLKYRHAIVESPEGIADFYRRSGYIHPVLTPGGCEVTGDFPPDHAHQHALFHAFVKTKFEGRSIDFWNQFRKTGRIRHVETVATCSGPIFASFTVKLRHEDISLPGKAIPVLDEIWTVRVYDLADAFLFDFESIITCATDRPLMVDKNHYGGMGIRGRTPWLTLKSADGTGQNFLTSEGKRRDDGNATRARWVEMHGPIESSDSTAEVDHAGVVIFGHPQNFRAPQHVRLHPAKPYFCFAPMVEGEYKISPGDEHQSQYRFYVHDGRPNSAKNQSVWCDYADGPTVKVVK